MPDAAHTRVLLAGHVLVTGPVQELQQYLLPRCERLVFIQHPLQPFTAVGDHRSRCTRYEAGRPFDDAHAAQWPLPSELWAELCLFARHAWLTLWWGITRGRGCTLFIGVNNLNALVGLVLQRLGCVRRVIYYTIDYIPQRFNAPWANAVYHWVDRVCVKRCDQTWNLSPRMAEARESRGVPVRYRVRQITVPHGTDLRVAPLAPDRVERRTIVYFGGLMEKQGVQLAIQALALVRRQVPDARLLIIGGGYPDRLTALQWLAAELNLREAVEFAGLIENHHDALDRIRRCAVGVAPYLDTPDNYTRYADPGKPKVYLAAGLPIIMTNVPSIAEVIAQHGAGVVVLDRADALADGIIPFLTDDQLFDTAKRRAWALAERYAWGAVFADALAQVPT